LIIIKRKIDYHAKAQIVLSGEGQEHY